MNVLDAFQKINNMITKNIEIHKQENKLLTELKELLLSKLATVEN